MAPADSAPIEPSAGAEASRDPGAADAADDVSPPDRGVIAEPNAGAGRRWLVVLAVAVALASLVGPISSSGIWDPHELRVADLARRIALTLLGGEALAIEGGNNDVPTLGELARGQLPFTSVAVGFRLFGLTEWAGRLPLAVWGLVGLGAVYAMVARLADRAAGAFAAIVLATTPLYFLHARTILGDVVTMAALGLATAGLAIAIFDRPDPGESRAARRLAWLVVAVAGLAAGFGARGALIGVAVPAVGVGLAWAAARSAHGRAGDRLGDATGAAALFVGGVAAYAGFDALAAATSDEFSMVLGAAVKTERQLPTHEFVIHQLGHGLFPWSAVIPFAVGSVLRPPPVAPGPGFERESGLRLVALLVPAIGLGAYGAMAPAIGHLPFSAVALLAVVVAIAVRDFERGAPPWPAAGMGVCALAVLLYVDFSNFPDKGLSAFAVDDPKFPQSFKERGTRIIKLGTLAMSGVFFLSFYERQRDVDLPPFSRAELLRWPTVLRKAYGGNLFFAFVVVTVALGGFALVTLLSQQHFHWQQFERMGKLGRVVAQHGWWAAPLAVGVGPIAVVVARDVVRWAYARVPLTRGAGGLLAVAALGAVLSLVYYPGLAAQISPKDVFTEYRRLSDDGEPLALMGTGAGAASYYAGRDVPTFSSVNAAFNWLVGGSGERRWLVIRSEDLPQMNSRYRAHAEPRTNLPVLDARSSEILLVSSELRDGEDNANPFDDWIRTERPEPQHAVRANLGKKLEAVGWDVRTPDGQRVVAVEPGKPYDFLIHWRVASKISGNWETFIHIDGFQRRYNGDHKTLEGRYAPHLWLVGDFITDVHRFTLEPNFTPGEYEVFYGLFIGSRRLEVESGAHHDDRLKVGKLRVE